MSADGYSYELNLSSRLSRHPVCQSQESYRRTLLNIATAQTYLDKSNSNYQQTNRDCFSQEIQKELWFQPQKNGDFQRNENPSLRQAQRIQHPLLTSAAANLRMDQNLNENIQQNNFRGMNKAQKLTHNQDNFTYSQQNYYPSQQISNPIRSSSTSFSPFKQDYYGNNNQQQLQQYQYYHPQQTNFEQTYNPYMSYQNNHQQEDLQNEFQYLQAFGTNSLSLANYPQNPPPFLQSYIDVLGGIEDTVGSMAKSLQANELKNLEDYHINFYSPNVPINGYGQEAKIQLIGNSAISSEIPKIKTEQAQMTFADLNLNENTGNKKDKYIDYEVIVQNSSELLEVQQLLGTSNEVFNEIGNNKENITGKNRTVETINNLDVIKTQQFNQQQQKYQQQPSQSHSSCSCQINTLNPVLQESRRLREERAKFLEIS